MIDVAKPPATPKASVILPVYNDARRLGLCLEALSRQTLPDGTFEIIVVDNGSTVGPAPVVARFDGIRLLREPRPGSYAARNKGIAAARGEFLAFTDADCIPRSGWLAAGIAALDDDPNVDAVGGRIELFARDSEALSATADFQLCTAFPQRMWVDEKGFSATANLFARRAAIDRVGGFDASFRSSGDWEWCLRLRSKGGRLVYSDAAVVDHPARERFAELVRKYLRLTGGHAQLFRALGRSRFALWSWILVKPWQRWKQHEGDPRVPTTSKRAALAAFELAICAVRSAELMRLQFGGRPRR